MLRYGSGVNIVKLFLLKLMCNVSSQIVLKLRVLISLYV